MEAGEKQLWFLKHAPKKPGECAGNQEALEELRKWALGWEAGKTQKPLLLAGPTGVGKTAAVRALAQEMNWVLVETNASDARGKLFIEKNFAATSASRGLFGAMRLLVFDEVDAGLERGGVTAISSFLAQAKQPVLLVANDAWEPSMASLRSACRILEFKALNAGSVKSVLKKIAEKEEMESGELVEEISRQCRGDLRSAINDLQAGFTGERERKQNIFKTVGKIFKTTEFREAMRAADESEEDFEMLFRWIEENIAAEYEKPGEVAEAFEWLSRANLFKARIAERQAWRMLKYVRVLSVAGVALSKQERYSKFTKYSFPSIVKKLAASRQSRAALKSALRKAARKLHCSLGEARKSLDLLGPLPGASSFFGFEEEEAALFAGAQEFVKQKRGNKKNKR